MKIALLPLCLFFVIQANALTDAEIQQRCGDDLRCYFSPEEIKAALGDNPDLEDGALQPSAHDPYEHEDEAEEVILDYEKENSARTTGDHGAPIWSSFISNFRSCASGCIPANYSTYGKRGKPSCHNTGRAVDVGAIVCSGKTHRAVSGGRFTQFVGCMKNKMKTIFRNGPHITLGHQDHAHFSNGCTVAGGRPYY